jgi:hypothetical protein
MPTQIQFLDTTNTPTDTTTIVSDRDAQTGVVVDGNTPTAVETPQDGENVTVMADIQMWLEEIC